LTEGTLLRLLWRSLRRQATCIVDVRSLFRGAATGHLDAVVRRLKRWGKISTLEERHPDLVHHANIGDLMRLTDVFFESEAWLETYLEFPKADERFGRYALAYRHACSNIAFRRFGVAHTVKNVLDGGVTQRVAGGDRFDDEFCRFRFGQSRGLGADFVLGRWIANLGIAVGVTVVTAWSILRALRLNPPEPESAFLGSEYQSSHDPLVWDEVVDERGQLIVVARNRAQYAEFCKALAPARRVCRHDDGVYSLAGGWAALVEATRDGCRLFRSAGGLPCDFFRALIVLPYRRMMFRALFNRYRFRYFWARDEYNSDHMMRSQELRRAGGIAMGIMHGIPSVCTVLHQLRYVDFDIYYVLGWDQVERYYRRTWPAHMRVRAIGSHGITRDLLSRLDEPGGNNVACFLGPSFHEDAILDAVVEMARALPERTVFINVKKPRYLTGSFGAALEKIRAMGVANVEFDSGNSYELLLRCRYVVCESSTLIAEALQFNRIGLALDPDARFKAHYYRRFPDICVASGAEAASRVRAYEAGSWSQQQHAYKRLIEMNPRVVWDIIREDFGLPPREQDRASPVSYQPAAANQ